MAGFMAVLKNKNVLIAAGAGLVVGYLIAQWRMKKAAPKPVAAPRPRPQRMPQQMMPGMMPRMQGMGNFDNLDDLGCGDKPCGACAAKSAGNDSLTGLAENTEDLYFGE